MSFPNFQLALAVVAMVSSLGAVAAAPTDAGALTFEQALERAVRRSESARSSRAGMAGAAESARAAGQLPDPMLRVGIENLPVTGPDRFSTTRDSQTMKRIGISQEWVSADKRAARTAAAQATVGREEAQLRASLADARLQAALAYLDAFYAAEALKLTQLMEHHAHEEFEVARARLASATGSGQEVLGLSSAWAMAEDDSAEIRQQQGAADVALQRWVGEGSGRLVAVPDIVGLSEAAFVDGHPGVLGKEQEVGIARLEAAATATNRRPNWTFEASYGQRTGYSDMASVSVSIPLPVARGARQDRDTAAKLALLEKAEAELAEARRTAQAEYAALVSTSRVLDQRIDLYRDGVVLPAGQRVEAAAAGYRSNQGTLLTLFEARRAEVEAQRKLLTLKRDFARARAQLAYRAWSAPRDAR